MDAPVTGPAPGDLTRADALLLGDRMGCLDCGQFTVGPDEIHICVDAVGWRHNALRLIWNYEQMIGILRISN